MKKFFAFCSAHLQNTYAARGERLVWVFIDAIPAFSMLQLWGYMERTGRMSPEQTAHLSVYYIMTLVISRLTSCHFEDWLTKDIRDGKMSVVFVRPIAYPVFLIAGELMWRLTGMLYLIPLFFVLGIKISYLNLLVFDGATYGIIALALVISFFIRFLMSWMISLAAFWIDEATFLSHFKWGLEGFLGGYWLPLMFMPAQIQTLAMYSPFYLWYYVPIQLLTGNIRWQETGIHIGVGIVWLIVCAGASWMLWKQAIKKYSAVGG